MFSHVPSYVKIEYAENKNWELGAWVYAYQKYHYKVYMFIQDSLTPISRIPSLNMFTFPEETIYSFHYHARLMDGGYLEELRHIYKDTKLHFLYELDPSTPLMGTAHTSFMTTHENVPILLQMEDAYIQKHVQKTKIHSWLSERIGGLLIDRESKKRLDLSTYFKKQHLGRN